MGKRRRRQSSGDAAPRETRALDVRIVETNEEIRLCFGAGRSVSSAESEPVAVVDTARQVILPPQAAKRLSLALRQALAEHEAIQEDSHKPSQIRPRRSRAQGNTSASPVVPKSGADRLIRLVEGLGVFYAREHSFKIFPGSILGDRVLLGFNQSEIGGSDGARSLLQVCRRLGMPEHFQKIYRERLSESNVILFGYEGNEQGGTWKAYLEFSGDYLTVVRKPGKPASALLHLGFKWDALDSRKASLTHYICYPELSVEDMLKRVRERFYRLRDTYPYEIVRKMVECAHGRVPSDEFLYMEVEEEGNPRHSYDINMYRAGLSLEDFYPWLREACRVNGIGPGTFHRLYQPMKEKVFGHVSGGQDRKKRDFLTFYYGGSRRSR